MVRLYKRCGDEPLRYHEAWENARGVTEHWGVVDGCGGSRKADRRWGTRGVGLSRFLAAFAAVLLVAVPADALTSEEEAPAVACETPVDPQDGTAIDKPRKLHMPPPRIDLERWGPIEVRAVISCEGKLVQIQVDKEMLDKVERRFRKGLSQWRFHPATLEGKPVAVGFNLTLGRPRSPG